MRRFLLALSIILLIGGSVVAIAAVRHHETGWFAPVFSSDGRAIYVVRRDVSAWVVGLGYEFFSPPARVRITEDRFAIWQIDPETGRSHEIAPLPASPAAGTWSKAYRPRLFGSVAADLEPAGQEPRLRFTVTLSRPSAPDAESWIAKGVLAPGGPQVEGWRTGGAPPRAAGPATLKGPLEVVAVPGRAMPCGVAIIESGARSVTPLVMSAACERRYGAPLAFADVESASHRARIERSQMLERTYADLVDARRTRGESDLDARLGAIRDMRRLGHYPPVRQLTARLVDAEEVRSRTAAGTLSPLFAIADEEFTAGLFPDLQRALDQPGVPVEKTIGRYMVDRRFETSRAINDFLKEGGTLFFVERRGRVYAVTLDMGTP